MGRIVIAAYRAKVGQEEALRALVAEHVPTLRKLRLATDRKVITMGAADGTIVEIFEWRSSEAIEAAHGEPVVIELWERFGEVAEYCRLGELDEVHQMFADFEPLDLVE